MKYKLFIFSFLLFGMIGCKKIFTSKQKADAVLPFSNENIEISVISNNLPNDLRAIHFFDELNGIATSYDGKVYKTYDKGINWTLKFTNPVIDQPFYDIKFKDQNIGYIIGGKQGCNGAGCTPPGGIVIKTMDAGETWNVIYQLPGTLEFTSLAINSTGDLYMIQNGFIPNTNFQTTILKSTDEGVSWETVDRISLGAYKIYFNKGIGFITGGTGDATIIRSLDDGTTWENIKKFTGNWVGDIAAYKNNIYTTVDGKHIYKSIDKGENWQLVLDGDHSYKIINPLSENVCLLFGTGDYSGGCFGHFYGAFSQTVDNGLNWDGEQFKELGYTVSTSFYNETDGYILNGKLIKVKLRVY